MDLMKKIKLSVAHIIYTKSCDMTALLGFLPTKFYSDKPILKSGTLSWK